MSDTTLAQKKCKMQNSYFDHFRTDVIETSYSERSKQSLNQSEANIEIIDHMT